MTAIGIVLISSIVLGTTDVNRLSEFTKYGREFITRHCPEYGEQPSVEETASMTAQGGRVATLCLATIAGIGSSGTTFRSRRVPCGRQKLSWAEQTYSNLIYWNEAEHGGHFAAFEQPDIFVEEMRSALRKLREQ